MENEYSHLENLIQDVSSLDTARMTLRWALERLNVLERSNKELGEKLRSASDGQKSAERRMKELEETVASRMGLFADQEAYYKKLEQTVALLSGGKVDLTQIARKEVDLDRVRREMAEEHRKQFEEMQRTHREMVERWTERLSKTEAFAPEKLSETIAQYDEFRRSLDLAHQERLAVLERTFHEKEERLLKREGDLEAACAAKTREAEALRAGLEARVQERLRELEAAHEVQRGRDREQAERRREGLEAEQLALRRRLEAEEARLREELSREREAGAEARRKEEERRLSELGKAWEAERRSLLEAKKGLEDRVSAAGSRIRELEDVLAASDRKREEAVLSQLSEEQRAFETRQADFERLQAEGRAALEETARQLEVDFAKRREEVERQAREARERDAAEHGRVLKAESERAAAGREEAERRLQGQLAAREASIRELQDRLQAARAEAAAAKVSAETSAAEDARARVAAEFEAILRARSEKEAALRLTLERQLQERDALFQEMCLRCKETQDRVVRAESVDNLAAFEEFKNVLKTREAEEAARRRFHEETWAAQQESIQRKWTDAAATLRKREERIAALEQELRKATEALRGGQDRVARLEGILADKAPLAAARDEMVSAGIEREKTELLRVHNERLKALEAEVREGERLHAESLEAERARFLEKLSVRERKAAELEKEIERRMEEIRTEAEARQVAQEAQFRKEEQRLREEGGALRAEAERLREEGGALRAEAEGLRRDREEILEDRDRLKVLQEQVESKRRSLEEAYGGDLGRLGAQAESLRAERDALAAEKERLRDQAQKYQAQLLSESAKFRQERDRLLSEVKSQSQRVEEMRRAFDLRSGQPAAPAADRGAAAEADLLRRRLQEQEAYYRKQLAGQEAQFNAMKGELIAAFDAYLDELEGKPKGPAR